MGFESLTSTKKAVVYLPYSFYFLAFSYLCDLTKLLNYGKIIRI